MRTRSTGHHPGQCRRCSRCRNRCLCEFRRLVIFKHTTCRPVLNDQRPADVELFQLVTIELRDSVWRQLRDHERKLRLEHLVNVNLIS
jgi:hypothetical protein